MHWLAFIAAIVLGFVFIYKEIEWLGLLFLALAAMALFIPSLKTQGKKVWEEVKEAEGSSPEKEFKGYFEETGRLAGEAIFAGPNKRYSNKDWDENISQGSKNVLEELKKM